MIWARTLHTRHWRVQGYFSNVDCTAQRATKEFRRYETQLHCFHLTVSEAGAYGNPPYCGCCLNLSGSVPMLGYRAAVRLRRKALPHSTGTNRTAAAVGEGASLAPPCLCRLLLWWSAQW